ncbi:hypothetical protein JKF63_06135 [Porcisia hertigi]|uniref:Sulfhydryl oxidase n=1 Tax=Porcisia hertigi TaxID=2761500 RepID=A0A836IWP2_9TRYP|nr:hypothetical protein JKF63_06135 [Porcisia hertigi]
MSDTEEQERLTTIPGVCPTPMELGMSGWNILHSSAAVYPYKPSAAQQEAMKNFIYSWAHVYACSWCAYHMREYVRNHPPNVQDKHTVSHYLCEMHNDVNERLGKDMFDCSPDVVLRRWHPGYPNKMEDQPTIEEQLAAADWEKSATKKAQHPQQEERERRFSPFGRNPREAGTNDAAAWRDANEVTSKADGGFWSRWFSGKPTSHLAEAASNAPQGPTSSDAPPTTQRQQSISLSDTLQTPPPSVVATTTGDIANTGASPHRYGWGNSTAEVQRSFGVATPTRGKAADDDTDIDAVLKRLKRCQVYCPENDDLNH